MPARAWCSLLLTNWTQTLMVRLNWQKSKWSLTLLDTLKLFPIKDRKKRCDLSFSNFSVPFTGPTLGSAEKDQWLWSSSTSTTTTLGQASTTITTSNCLLLESGTLTSRTAPTKYRWLQEREDRCKDSTARSNGNTICTDLCSDLTNKLILNGTQTSQKVQSS